MYQQTMSKSFIGAESELVTAAVEFIITELICTVFYGKHLLCQVASIWGKMLNCHTSILTASVIYASIF